MFAETDFGLVADVTLDSTDKASVAILAFMVVVAVGALIALAWTMRGAF
jgi:hypothetical protein